VLDYLPKPPSQQAFEASTKPSSLQAFPSLHASKPPGLQDSRPDASNVSIGPAARVLRLGWQRLAAAGSGGQTPDPWNP